VMSGVVPPTVDETPARPASHVWSASVDVLLRTRRNADTISGAAPEVNQRRCCRGSRGSASLPVATASANQIGKPKASSPRCFLYARRSGSNPKPLCPTTFILDKCDYIYRMNDGLH
jgi:hypothetical protein